MTNIWYLLAAVVIGACLSMQPGINAVSARTLGSPIMAAIISLAISLILALLIWAVWERDVQVLSNFKALPWWIIAGGAIGALFVTGALMIVPTIGVALFFVCIVAGQLMGASLADQFGAFGLEVKAISLSKVAGLALVLAGAYLVQRG